MIPTSHPACVLVRDQASMNCGRSAGTVEYPVRPRISATHTAAMVAAEGRAWAELAELTDYQLRLCVYGVTVSSSSRRLEVGEWAESSICEQSKARGFNWRFQPGRGSRINAAG